MPQKPEPNDQASEEQLKQFTVRLPADVHYRLRLLSLKTGRTANDMLCDAVRRLITESSVKANGE